VWEVPWSAAKHFVRDDCTLHAAAIAYYSLLSLAPALYVVALLLEAVFHEGDVSRRVVAWVSDFLPPAAVPPVASVQAALEVHGTLLVIALPGLFWIATHALHAFQGALNVAFARKPQGYAVVLHGTRLKSFLVLIGGTALLGTLQLLDGALALAQRFGTQLGFSAPPAGLSGGLALLATPALTFAVFLLFYRLLPAGRCPSRPAIVGALVAVSLWEAARLLFSLVLARSPAYGLVTGTLAGVLAFLVWIYLGVVIVLFGAEIAAVVNRDRPA
jgi:membrane protein